MITHLIGIKAARLACSMLCLLPLLTVNVLGQERPTRRRGAATARKAAVRIAVLPFRDALSRRPPGGGEVVLGDGIADSLTNGLKSVAGLEVLDSVVVLRTAAGLSSPESAVGDEEALRAGEALRAQIIVVGSFQLNGNYLHVDARILTVSPDDAVPAQTMTADGTYPDGYSALLDRLIHTILDKIKVPVGSLSAADEKGGLAGTNSPEAYRLFLLGLREAQENSEDALSKAVKLFGEALAIAPDYSQAQAEKSKAEGRLYRLRQGTGEAAASLKQSAIDDAVSAVSKSPRSGRAYNALWRAQALGREPAAAQSKQRASNLWPGDIESFLDLAGALENGSVVRSATTDAMLYKYPELAVLLPQLPKVYVKNDSEYPLTVRLIPEQGRPYPTIHLAAGGHRVLPLLPGPCRIIAESEGGTFSEKDVYVAGHDYDYTITFPSGTFSIVNDADCGMTVRLDGPVSKTLSLRATETKKVKTRPGSYTVTGRVRGASTSDDYELSAGEEKEVTFQHTCDRVPIFDPADLAISNDGNTAFTATIIGQRRFSVSVPPGGRTVTVPAGTYTVRVTCGGDVSDAGEYELRPNTETPITGYDCRLIYRRYIIR